MTHYITTYRNLTTGETAPAHCVGVAENGDEIYLLPDGWEPVEEYWLDADGLAHAAQAFVIETRPSGSNDARDWTTDGLGDQNEFDAREQAKAAIVDLQRLGDDWATAQYRVVVDGAKL